MKQNGSSAYVTYGLLSCGLVLMVIAVYQLNALEGRFVAQSAQLRTLGETSERLASEMGRLQVGAAPSTTADDCKIARILHPEVDNFLSPKGIHWPPEGAAMDGTLTRGWPSGDPKGFNWMIENAADLGEYVSNYADATLAERNRWTDPGTWYGDLACRVEITDDYKEYTFYLRQGVLWHEPSGVDVNDPQYAWLKGRHELTAHDFVFTFDVLMNPQVENGFTKNYYEDLESWKAVDDYTLVVRWKKKTYVSVAATLGASALPQFLFGYAQDGKPFPKETLGLKFNQHWYNNKGYVGVGAYRQSSYEPGRKISLQRVGDYFGETPAIQRIDYSIYTDPNQTVLKLKANEIAWGYLQPGQYREEVLQWQDTPENNRPNSPFLNGQIHCEVRDLPAYFYLGWNADKPTFADPRVRTAMTLALRRQEIIDKVFVGLGDIALGPFLPETGYHAPDVDPLAFDLERARTLLAEAGWTDTDGDGLRDKLIGGTKTAFEFTLLIYGNSPEFAALSNIFKDDLLKLGVRMKIESAEWSLMQKKMDEKQFDAFTGSWLLSWDTDAYQLWHSSQADVPKGSNKVSFRNSEADKLIEQARVTFDEDKRRELFQGIHRLIYDAQAYTFFARRKRPFCWRDYVKGVRFAKVRPLDDVRPWYVEAAP